MFSFIIFIIRHEKLFIEINNYERNFEIVN